MSLRSTPTRYGPVAILIHWTSAGAIVLTFAAGLAAANLADPLRQTLALGIHIGLGSLVLALTLLRIIWWLLADRRPALSPDQPRWQQRLAHFVHGLLYAVILLMASSGIATLVVSGALPHVLAGDPLPDLSHLVPRLAHGALSRVLLALLALHVSAALYHQIIRRDGTLARMGVGSAR